MKKQYTSAFKAQVIHEVLREERTLSQIAAQYGIHPTQLGRWKAIALEGLPRLFADGARKADTDKATHERQLQDLYAEIGKLNTQLAWLKKNLVSNFPREDRLPFLDRGDAELSLRTQAELLGLNRSSLYYRPQSPRPEEVAIKHRIDELYTKYPFYGSRRITVELNKEIAINRKAVQRHMREMGIAGICPGPNLSKRRLEHRIYPYLLRDITASYPNHVWGVDITYIRLRGGWMYLVAVLDWYSRYVVSWELEQMLEIGFVIAAVERALARGKPVIWNSDQGSHFTSPQYIRLLEEAEVQISMDGKGRAIDNIFTERLWRTIKYEEVYLKDYSSPKEARQGLREYLEFYNNERPHQSLQYRTPAVLYLGEGEQSMEGLRAS